MTDTIGQTNTDILSINVTSTSGGWPPGTAPVYQYGSITEGATGNNSYYDRGMSPDRLRFYITSPDGPPRLALYRPSDDTIVEYNHERTYSNNGYRISINSDSLRNAGYDNYVVIYTGPDVWHATSILTYEINSWNQSQNPLCPLADPSCSGSNN